MKPLAHARLGATRHGGTWNDTITIHSWLDSSKSTFASVQHRALLHHDVGVEIGHRAFGTLTLSNDTTHNAKHLLGDHVVEDLGSVVSVNAWLDEIDPTSFTRRVSPDHRQLLVLRTNPAQACALRYGGEPCDYTALLEILDLPEIYSGSHPSAQMLFHNSFGPFIVESVLGAGLSLTNGKLVATRTIVEELIIARTGWIAPASLILSRIPNKDWMRGVNVPDALVERKAQS